MDEKKRRGCFEILKISRCFLLNSCQKAYCHKEGVVGFHVNFCFSLFFGHFKKYSQKKINPSHHVFDDTLSLPSTPFPQTPTFFFFSGIFIFILRACSIHRESARFSNFTLGGGGGGEKKGLLKKFQEKNTKMLRKPSQMMSLSSLLLLLLLFPIGVASQTPAPSDQTPAPSDSDHTVLIIIIASACGVLLIVGGVVIYCCTRPDKYDGRSGSGAAFQETLNRAAGTGDPRYEAVGGVYGNTNRAPPAPEPPREFKVATLPKEAPPVTFDVAQIDEGVKQGRTRTYFDARDILRVSRKGYVDKDHELTVQENKERLRGLIDVEELIEDSITDWRVPDAESPSSPAGVDEHGNALRPNNAAPPSKQTSRRAQSPTRTLPPIGNTPSVRTFRPETPN